MGADLQCGHTQLQDICPYCISLQTRWYATLQANGFSDIENNANKKRPLKTSAGISIQVACKDSDETVDIIELLVSQEPNAPFATAFPESHFSTHQRLLQHPEFDRLSSDLCSHGNHKLTPDKVRKTWALYIEGESYRAIAAALGINYLVVFRTVRSLTQWMELMDLDEEEPIEPLSKVVLRKFEPARDEAFIYASWRNALWYDDDRQRREGDSERFFRQATASIKNILENPKTMVRIACLADNHDLILGYSVITGLCLHFVYVKADYRNKRIGSLLVPRTVEAISPVLTKIGRAIAIKKGFIKQNNELSQMDSK